MIDADEKRVLKRLRDDFIHYAEHCLKLRTKSGSIVEFQLNRSQLYIHTLLEEQRARTGKVRALILKARQQGCSTYVGARFYHQTTFKTGIQTFILSHELGSTNNLYDMVKRFYEYTPEDVKPIASKSNAKALVFGELDSGYRLGTAENKRVGRSATIQLLHLSEAAHFRNAAELKKGLLQSVPDAENTEILIESTANGIGGFFHEEWQKAESGESEYLPIFVPWYWQDEYSKPAPDDFVITDQEEQLALGYGLNKNQLYWRRNKIIDLSAHGADGTKAFRQEYPSCAAEAFILTGEDNYISSDLIVDARKARDVEAVGPLLIGCDPARFGQDRTAIVFRQGRVAFDLMTYVKKDTMEVVGILHSLILKHKPARMFIDVGGLGAGIYDRLKELGHADTVVSCNSGSTPLDEKRYRNKRAEMWGTMKEWLADGPVSIPDDDCLHADMANTKYKFDSNTRLLMESKDEMKKRGVRSSDTADALCLVAGTMIRTPSGSQPIENLVVGDEVITPFGKTKIVAAWVSKTQGLTTVNFSNGSILSGKGEHKVFTWNTGECRLDELQSTFEVENYTLWNQLKWALVKLLFMKAKNSQFRALVDTIRHTRKMHRNAFFIAGCGRICMAPFLMASLFITKMVIGATTILQILSSWMLNYTPKCIWAKQELQLQSGIHHQQDWLGIPSRQQKHGEILQRSIRPAQFVGSYIKPLFHSALGSAQQSAIANMCSPQFMPKKKESLGFVAGALKNLWPVSDGKWRVAPLRVRTENIDAIKVYNLTLEKHNAYYANDILVFNCLTFFLPDLAITMQKKEKQDKLLKKFAQNYEHRKKILTKT